MGYAPPFTYQITRRGSGGRHGEGSDAQQQRKEEAEAGQEQEERRRSALTVRRHAQPGQTRHLVHEPIRQEALAGDHRARHQRELAPGAPRLSTAPYAGYSCARGKPAAPSCRGPCLPARTHRRVEARWTRFVFNVHPQMRRKRNRAPLRPVCFRKDPGNGPGGKRSRIDSGNFYTCPSFPVPSFPVGCITPARRRSCRLLPAAAAANLVSKTWL
jgi:hypothetical protein